MFDFPLMNGSSLPEDDEMLEIGGAVESEVEREGVKLREDLQFYFMSPCDKYRARRQIPWKLALQVLKIVMVTTQLVLFGLSNQLVVSFKEGEHDGVQAPGYTGVDEDDYSRTVYTQRDLYDSIYYVIDQYHHIGNLSLGTVSYENEEKRKGLKICKQHYHRGFIHPSNDTFYVDPTVETECLHLEPELPPRDRAINSSFFNLEFYRLLKVEISFRLKGIDLQTIRVRELPDCYITFNNQAHSGKVKIFFESDATIQDCKDWQISGSIQKNTHYILVFDAFVILTCLTSLILCSRSIVLAIKLLRRFVRFFLNKYNLHVSSADRWEFVNGWYVMVIISDLMTIIGSVMKMEIKAKNLTSYDVCSLLLGTSTLLVWVGVIRYLGYFQKYNVLILTMQASLPKVLRFCCCAGMIYLGYTFCGWIVLGPYHEKVALPYYAKHCDCENNLLTSVLYHVNVRVISDRNLCYCCRKSATENSISFTARLVLEAARRVNTACSREEQRTRNGRTWNPDIHPQTQRSVRVKPWSPCILVKSPPSSSRVHYCSN
ncbi:unnamed protein product [Ranitomeya imitator]|uniref:Mucolipin extracytosolic domain-containing protein n=1 Tax=Ranitomeya imitator TaxID=111125 RepID=A0ABN9M4U2_9NEOB|nr:unnamed protein product [Ranitomeya imitator]